MSAFRSLRVVQSSGRVGHARLTGSDRYRRAGMTAGAALGARLVTMTVTLVTVRVLLDYLGAERYGMWLTISAIAALLVVLDLGVGNGLLNAVTRNTARGDVTTNAGQISSALVLLTALAMLIAVPLAIVYPIIPWDEVLAVTTEPAVSEAGPAIAVVVALFLVGLPLSVITQVRLGRQEGYLVHLAAAVGSIAVLAALFMVVVSRQGVPMVVVAMTVPLLVAVAANGWFLFRRDAPEIHPARNLVKVSTGIGLLRSGFLFFVLQLAMAVAFMSDTLVVAQMVGPEAVAEYGVVFRLFAVPAFFMTAILSPLWPAYGDAIALGDTPWVRRTLAHSVRLALAISVPAAALLVTFGESLIAIWVDASVTPPFSLILGFGVWIVLSALGNAVAMLLNGAHEIRMQAGAAALMAVTNLALSIWLTSQIGVAGVIWGTVMTYAAFVLLPMALFVPPVLRRISASHAAIPTEGDGERP